MLPGLQRKERRARYAARTAEEREARLQQLRVTGQHRLASETGEEREARLQQLRVTGQQRLAKKSENVTVAILLSA